MNEEGKNKLHVYFQARYLQEKYPTDFGKYVQTQDGFSVDGFNNMVAEHQAELDDSESIFDGWDDLGEEAKENEQAFIKQQDEILTQEVLAAKNGAKINKMKRLRACKSGCGCGGVKTAKSGMKVKEIIEKTKNRGKGDDDKKDKHKYNFKRKHRL